MKDSPQKKEGKILKEIAAKATKVADLVCYADGSIVSKTLIDKAVGTITLFAFDVGQGLSEHRAPYDAVVEVIEGKALITVGGEAMTVSAGEITIMPANVPHSVLAEEKFKMILTMIRSD